jgi:molybdate transport system substrate-binding protein
MTAPVRNSARVRATRSFFAQVVCLLLLTAVGCSKPKPTPPPEQELVIFAAASLREAFTALGAEFKLQHPGVELTFNFAGTQELRTQIEQGAAVDVFASADQKNMDTLVAARLVAAAQPFARNEPVVVVARDSAAAIRGLADLPLADRIVVGAPEVPIGRYTLQILDRAAATLGADFRTRVEAKVVSRELNVRQVLSKVSLGEAQAGIVYRTDAQAALDKVSVVTIPSEVNVIAEYPLALTSSAVHPELARAWVDFVLSSGGQRLLLNAGFLTPPNGGSGK